MSDRLVLGTVQLGLPYGISNTSGKPDFNRAFDIVKTAVEQGVTSFDTAQSYGDSEEVLGRVFDKLKICGQVKVYTKLDPKIELSSRLAVEQSVDGSLKKLKIDRLEGLLLHYEDGMRFWNEGLGGTLKGLVAKGKTKFAGASFYTPQRAVEALDVDGIDIIQVPANIFDRRFEKSGVFSKAKERGKKVFIRSVFLQGLLLMQPDQVPVSMKYALPYLERLEQLAGSMKLTRQELALGYAAKQWARSSVLFGAEDSLQVKENVRAFFAKIPEMDQNIFDDLPEDLLNPATWNTGVQ